MERIKVNASLNYDVVVGNGILEQSGELVADIIKPCKAIIVTDDLVASLYLEKVKKSFENSGFEVSAYIFPNGERSKNIETLTSILEYAADEHITRSDIFVALGGGVVGDITGFAAATFMRGIRFVQIPTTFLADIDSSVGGKTAVNLKNGKNLCGAFHQPSIVICDTDCLKTLSYETFLDGVAEAIKYAVLKDETLIGLIETDLNAAIVECIEIKRDIVAEDEFENGSRKLLNLGHTLGHAIEALSGFSITHGHAVAIGMVIASRGGEKIGITEMGTTNRIVSVLEHFGLPFDCEYTPEELVSVALGDKKRDGNNITIVVPQTIGKCKLCKIPVGELKAFICK